MHLRLQIKFNPTLHTYIACCFVLFCFFSVLPTIKQLFESRVFILFIDERITPGTFWVCNVRPSISNGFCP